ncbi:MAG: hypothetical protein R3C14_13795 [Caldilineaceae bacterium]
MITRSLHKHIVKIILAVALTLTVIGTTGAWDAMLGLHMTPSAYACVGSGSGAGGDC